MTSGTAKVAHIPPTTVLTLSQALVDRAVRWSESKRDFENRITILRSRKDNLDSILKHARSGGVSDDDTMRIAIMRGDEAVKEAEETMSKLQMKMQRATGHQDIRAAMAKRKKTKKSGDNAKP